MGNKRSRVTNEKFYTFDIETTTFISDITKDNQLQRDAFIWSSQFYDGTKYTTFRTLEDTIRFLNQLNDLFSNLNDKLLIYVHNLSYEYQFIKDFFEWKKVLCLNERKIISAETEGLVFRCSYRLSNMSLERFLIAENVPDKYLKSKMDYQKRRFPWTPLTEDEEIYIRNDVIGLHKAIENILNHMPVPDLNDIPLTSTGYVRKDVRDAMKENPRNRYRFYRESLTSRQYEVIKEAFRGGNTHANRFNSNKVCENVGSYDEASAYIYELLTRKFPGAFHTMKAFTWKEFNFFYKHSDEWALLFVANFKGLKLKDNIAVPYISLSKVGSASGDIVVDNGRIINLEYAFKIALTEVDYKIILSQYEFDDIKIEECYYARKYKLPLEMRKVIIEYFYSKCTLKGVDDYFYSKSKNKLNSTYGMCVSSPVRSEYEFNEITKLLEEVPQELDEGLESFYKSFGSFLSYQWGVWVTAYAREDLQEAIDVVEFEDFIYCDTDSTKIKNVSKYKEAFETINDYRRKQCEDNEAYVDYNGKRFYLGVFEFEGESKYFKTFGAKKYIYGDDNDNFKITISGVPKSKGKECIKKAIKDGKFNNFYDLDLGFIFKSIKMTSAYNDYTGIKEFTFPEGKVSYASNIALYDADYTLGLSADYEQLLYLYNDKEFKQ